MNKKVLIIFVILSGVMFLCVAFNEVFFPPKLMFKKIHSVELKNYSWIQEAFVENGVLYSVACIRDLEPRLYRHVNVTHREYVKRLCQLPPKPKFLADGDYIKFHRGLAICRVNDTTYVFLNMHNRYTTFTALYTGSNIENLVFLDFVSFAGYFGNTTVNWRIREVWFNYTDNKFYCYYDGSSIQKGTHLHTYLGVSDDPYFSKKEYTHLYSAVKDSNSNGGIYAPHVLWLDRDIGIGCVESYREKIKPYDFDCDLITLESPKKISFYTDREAEHAFFEEHLAEESQLSMFLKYNGKTYLFTRNGPNKYGEIYEVDIRNVRNFGKTKMVVVIKKW